MSWSAHYDHLASHLYVQVTGPSEMHLQVTVILISASASCLCKQLIAGEALRGDMIADYYINHIRRLRCVVSVCSISCCCQHHCVISNQRHTPWHLYGRSCAKRLQEEAIEHWQGGDWRTNTSGGTFCSGTIKLFDSKVLRKNTVETELTKKIKMATMDTVDWSATSYLGRRW